MSWIKKKQKYKVQAKVIEIKVKVKVWTQHVDGWTGLYDWPDFGWFRKKIGFELVFRHTYLFINSSLLNSFFPSILLM